MNKIFVYGTLQTGMYNNGYMNPDYVETFCNATTKGQLFMVKNCTYPAIIKGVDDIHGELYTIQDKYMETFLLHCDRLECHPTYYKREITKVIDDKGVEHDAYIYVFQRHDLLGRQIFDGDYKKFYKSIKKRIVSHLK